MQPSGNNQQKVKWYFHPAVIIAAIFAAGPLALPLVWLSPSLNKIYKVLFTILIIALTAWLVKVSVDLYNLILGELNHIQEMLK
ncbi:MAG: hypothetical protein JXB40_04055 [Candidatus Omnitrophica bacterium]|nr:hypothetical protein [Candidatus Omnitrophota bacterium]